MSDSLALAERNVPRYTSYPTAPHFNADVTSGTYAGWLADLTSRDRLSLYLHVPYCTNLCLYCGCHTKVMRRREPLDVYAGLLTREIRLTGTHTPARQVTHLHWGGGTPSILGEERMTRLIETIGQTFDLGKVEEHAIELDPRHISPGLVHALAANGVNRASLGVQNLTPKVQAAIGRIQPFEQVRRANDLLRGAGITRINADLMYGLPHQTVGDTIDTVEKIATLAPDRIALFGYAHVPWFKSRQRLIDASALPGLAERMAQARAAAEALVRLGYVAIGLDHFARAGDGLAVAARTGRLHRNFQGYTTDQADALLGFGVSSIGRLPQGYVQNAADVGNYERAINDSRFATVRGLAMSDDDKLRARIIEELMCNLAVDLDQTVAALGIPGTDFAAELAVLKPLTDQKLVRIEGRRIAVTETGRPFLRLVAAAFDAYLANGKSRHSVAV